MKKIVKFEKENCNPCKQVSEFLDKKFVEYEKVNPFNNPELAVKHKIRSVPTVILFEDDEELKRVIGFKPEELQNLVDLAMRM